MADAIHRGPHCNKTETSAKAFLPAGWMLDGLKQDLLLKMLEWWIEIGREWSWRPGLLGKGLKRILDPETYDELVATCVGGGIGALWEALFRTTALFRKTAIRVGKGLGYAYLHDLDQRVSVYLETVRQLDHTGTAEDLAHVLKER